jgi:hypothetical protein
MFAWVSCNTEDRAMSLKLSVNLTFDVSNEYVPNTRPSFTAEDAAAIEAVILRTKAGQLGAAIFRALGKLGGSTTKPFNIEFGPMKLRLYDPEEECELKMTRNDPE